MSPRKAKKLARPRTQAVGWSALTWHDLERWAGSRSVQRGRTYQRQARVEDLICDEEGRLLATVVGGDRYLVSVWLEPAGREVGPVSTCTCPVGASGCKHAVAVVSEFLEALAEGRDVPTDSDDPRWARLADQEAAWADDEDEEAEWDEYGEDEGAEDDGAPAIPARSRRGAKRSTRAAGRQRSDEWGRKIQQHLRQQSAEQLADLVWSLVQRFPELREEFKERIALSEGDVGRLVAQARTELRKCTADPGWRNHWDNQGYTPNYTGLRHRLERLVEMGHADQVVPLGRELIERGIDQVEQSQDDGQTGEAVAECFPVIFQAVLRSSLPAPEKLLFAIDACLKDDIDLLGSAADAVLEASWSAADWSAAADALARRLELVPKSDSKREFSGSYQRDCLSGWLCLALEKAGRGEERLAIYEREARVTQSYERLVRHLIEHGRLEDAQRWAGEGIENTMASLPGIAANLTNMLGELAQRRKQWDVAAAHAACRFLTQPSASGFAELMAAVKKAGCEDAVRRAALRYLETGASPIEFKRTGKGKDRPVVEAAWPLPLPDYLVPMLRRDLERPGREPGRPRLDVLLDMALEARRPEEILRWYDQLRVGEKQARGGWGWATGTHYESQVAKAVAQSHPVRALEIYSGQLKQHLPEANLNAYEQSAACLENMRPILRALGRGEDWDKLVAGIREQYRNRPRFMEVLDRLDPRPIVKTHPARRGRR